LKEYFIVSQVSVDRIEQGDGQELIPGVFIKVDKASGEKCVRCWQRFEQLSGEGVCNRCEGVLPDKS